MTSEVPPSDPGPVVEPPDAFRTPALFSAVPPPRLAVSVLFFVNGAVFAAWAANIPAVQRSLRLESWTLGLVLLAIPAGAMAGMPLSAWLAPALGSRRIAVVSSLIFCATLPLLALAPNPVSLALALWIFGSAGGATDVTMNAQATEVERLRGRPVISSFHALFSLGGLAGSGLVAASVALGVSPLTHLVPVALLGFLAALAASPGLLPPVARRPTRKRPFARPPASLLGLGALAFAVLLCEGAAADWSAVYLRNDLGAGPATAAAGFGAFSLAMAVGRLCGDRMVHRLGPVAVVRGSGAGRRWAGDGAANRPSGGRRRRVRLPGPGLLQRRARALQRGRADAGRRAGAGAGGRHLDGVHGVPDRAAADRPARAIHDAAGCPRAAGGQRRIDRVVRGDGPRPSLPRGRNAG